MGKPQICFLRILSSVALSENCVSNKVNTESTESQSCIRVFNWGSGNDYSLRNSDPSLSNI